MPSDDELAQAIEEAVQEVLGPEVDW